MMFVPQKVGLSYPRSGMLRQASEPSTHLYPALKNSPYVLFYVTLNITLL